MIKLQQALHTVIHQKHVDRDEAPPPAAAAAVDDDDVGTSPVADQQHSRPYYTSAGRQHLLLLLLQHLHHHAVARKTWTRRPHCSLLLLLFLFPHLRHCCLRRCGEGRGAQRRQVARRNEKGRSDRRWMIGWMLPSLPRRCLIWGPGGRWLLAREEEACVSM